MRLALICQNFNARGGVSRDAFMFAAALRDQGVAITCYCDPETSTRLEDVALRDVASTSTGLPPRLGGPIAHATFAYRATHAIGRDRALYDVVLVVGTNAFAQHAVRVHAVVKAENRRWPERGGSDFRHAALRARVAPVVRPLNGIERAIQRHQFDVAHSRRLIAVTDEVKQDIQDLYGFPAERIDVLPCPIDFDAIRAAAGADARRQIGLPNESKLLLFLGNDFHRKGLDRAILVLPKLPSDVHLVVVGEGPSVPFRRLAEKWRVQSRTHFIGHAPQPERFLRDADVLLLPTREDVWGIALVEAMAAGLPIVTTAVAGASAVVAEAGAGRVVADPSITGLADAVRGLLGDSGSRRRSETRGVEVAKAYDVARLGRTLEAILERAAETPPQPDGRLGGTTKRRVYTKVRPRLEPRASKPRLEQMSKP
jgi:glycosyltransferase involved in cell wall biosynthesis